MATLTKIAQYSYIYGAGSRENRRIEFKRNGSNPQTIIANVIAIIPNEHKIISNISGNNISVEMMSTSQKAQALQAQRQGFVVERIPDCSLSQLDADQQDQILSKLEPDGPWRIEITNGFGSDPRFENVARLNLFNPS